MLFPFQPASRQGDLKRTMKTEELLSWFQNSLIPDIAKRGYFSENGEHETIEKCEFNPVQHGVHSFASNLCFSTIYINGFTGARSINVLIKYQNLDPVFRKKMKTEPQFQNEVTMFNEVLPGFTQFLKNFTQEEHLIREIIPKCYFALYEKEDLEKSVVILEDLGKFGYRPSDSIVELDLNHCLMALQQLAKFHAISFAMKFANTKNFEKLKNLFVPVWFSNDQDTREQCEQFKSYCAQRGINFLLSKKNSEVPMEYLEKFRKRLERLFDFLMSLLSSEEPLAVICHGDFNRNNILYQYSGGKVVSAKLIDFQTSFYGSPCLDLSFFIYMNTTIHFREKHFEEIFSHYYSALTRTTSVLLNVPQEAIVNRIPLDLFKHDFERVAVHAYVTVSFFLPVMMAPSGNDFDEDLVTKTYKELAVDIYNQGGDVVSERIANVIVDFYRRKFYTNI